MKHIWSVLCTKGIINKSSNNISLIEIIEEIKCSVEIQGSSKKSANIKMVGQIPLEWITLWTRSDPEIPEKTEVKDIILSPSGKKVFEKGYEISLLDYKRTRATRRILIPPANENGIFYLSTKIKDNKKQTWNTVIEVPLAVNIERTKITK